MPSTTEDSRTPVPGGPEREPDAAASGEQSLVEETEAGAAADAFGSGTSAAEALPAGEPGAPDFHDRWLRSEAELQNFRRRAQRDRDEARRDAEERVLLDVVELLDDLERALASVGDDRSGDPLVQGVALTAQRMRDVLARYGVMRIPSIGLRFDPTVHEALLEVEAPAGTAPGAVVKEILPGWQRGVRALRAARVVVAREGSGS